MQIAIIICTAAASFISLKGGCGCVEVRQISQGLSGKDALAAFCWCHAAVATFSCSSTRWRFIPFIITSFLDSFSAVVRGYFHCQKYIYIYFKWVQLHSTFYLVLGFFVPKIHEFVANCFIPRHIDAAQIQIHFSHCSCRYRYSAWPPAEQFSFGF